MTSQSMVSDQTLTQNVSPRLTIGSLPLPASNVASASHQHPPNPTASSVPDNAAICGAQSSNLHRPIDVDDIVIAVMGVTRAGKSTFINKAAGRMEIVVTNDLASQTRAVKPVRCLHPDGRRSVVLVDTPGFDDTYLSDAQILKIVAHWLKETYQDNIKLSGLLYLHRISDNRIAGTPLRQLSVFKDVCGENNMKNIVLVTTMWDVEDEAVGSEREEHLLSVFWKDMIRHGSRTCRFQGTRESAWEIIDYLDLERTGQRRTPLQIQREMVDRGLPFDETVAAKTLHRSFTQRAGEAKKFSAKLRNKFRRKTTPRRPEKIAAKTLHCSLNQRAGEGNTTAKYLRRCLTQLAKVKKFFTKLRNKSRRKATPREPPLRLRPFPIRSSTIRSNSSGASWSVVSSASSSSIASSLPPGSPAESAISGCSAYGRQDTLLAAIRGLELAHQAADIANIPMLRGIIGTALRTAQLSQEMGGMHHVVIHVIESTAWLLEEITRYAARSELSRDMKRALNSFQRELNNLQTVVTNISDRSHIARFFLYDADIQTITVCTASIKNVYDRFEIKLALDNRLAITRLEDQLTELLTSTSSRKREYGMLNTSHGEASGNGQPSASTSKPIMDNRQAIAQLEGELMALSENTALRKCECGTLAVLHGEARENGLPSDSPSQSS